MPFDLEKLVASLFMMLVGSSILLVAVAVAWRLVMRPTLRALLEYRAARGGADPVLSRQVTELAEEVRGLKDKLAALSEGSPSRLLGGADVAWRGTKEKT
jgi:hypothetical protein